MDKKQMLNIQNFVKDEGNNIRLSSLRLPRDLSLGGSKPKKMYTPNLNVVRNKYKSKEIVRKIEKKNTKSNFPRHNTRNTQNPRYLQTEGIFTEGTVEERRPARHIDRSVSYKERDTVATMVLPKINRNSWSVNNRNEEVVIADLLADSESDMEEDDIYAPIVLKNNQQSATDVNVSRSSTDVKPHFNGFKIEDNVMPTISIKQEIKNHSRKVEDTKLIKFEIGHETLCHTFSDFSKYSDSNPCLSLVKLPDSFAGRGGSDDPSDKNVDFPLKDMLEGKIGRILIRKSGKREVQIGRIIYEIDSVKNSDFCEEVMSVPEKPLVPGVEIDIAKIGSIQEQYLITPLWKNLVKKEQ